MNCTIFNINYTLNGSHYEHHEPDQFSGLFNDFYIKTILLSSYFLAYLSLPILGMVIWFEISGQAGHYRTMINKMASFNLGQMVLFITTTQTIQLFRALLGPLSDFVCHSDFFLRSIITTNIAMSNLVGTFAKFTFICIYKSIPNFNDDFLTAVAVMVINMISVISVSTRLYLVGKQIPYHVSDFLKNLF